MLLQLLAVQSSDADMMRMLGVRPAECPAVLLYDQQNRTKYRPSVGHQLTVSKIWLFVRSALDGKLQVYTQWGDGIDRPIVIKELMRTVFTGRRPDCFQARLKQE